MSDRPATPAPLDVLRCPICGGSLDFRAAAGASHADATGVLVCEEWCSEFPVLRGIACLMDRDAMRPAYELVERGEPDLAVLGLVGVDPSHDRAEALLERPGTLSIGDAIALLRHGADVWYFLYRFCDPTFVTAEWVLRSMAAQLRPGAVLDLGAGMGHLSRALAPIVDAGRIVVADGLFANLRLAKHYIAPGSTYVYCNADYPLPFAGKAISLAFCADAFHYMWFRRKVAWELGHLVHDEGVMALPHAHDALHPDRIAAGRMPLSPAAHRRLFPGLETRVYREGPLFDAATAGRGIDLGGDTADDDTADEPAVLVAASASSEIFRALPPSAATPPARSARREPDVPARAVRRIGRAPPPGPAGAYQAEFGAYRAYLPELVSLPPRGADNLRAGAPDDLLLERFEQRVLLDVAAPL